MFIIISCLILEKLSVEPGDEWQLTKQLPSLGSADEEEEEAIEGKWEMMLPYIIS